MYLYFAPLAAVRIVLYTFTSSYFADEKMAIPDAVIGISAELRGGKGICVKIFETIFHGETSVVSSGMVLFDTACILKRDNPSTRSTTQNLYSELSVPLGKRFLHPGIKERWEKSGKRIWIFDGVLMPWDVEFIRSFPRNILFFVDCEIRRRYERARLAALRGEASAKPDEAKMTFEEFKKRHKHETAKYVASIKNLPDVRTLNNNGTVEQLADQIIKEFMIVHCLIDPEQIFKPDKQRAFKELYDKFQPQ